MGNTVDHEGEVEDCDVAKHVDVVSDDEGFVPESWYYGWDHEGYGYDEPVGMPAKWNKA